MRFRRGSCCCRSVLPAVRLSALVWLSLALLASPALAATYYMAPNGSDSASGSQSSPWKTLDASVAKLSAGDTLILRGGLLDIISRVPPEFVGRSEVYLASIGEATFVVPDHAARIVVDLELTAAEISRTNRYHAPVR